MSEITRKTLREAPLKARFSRLAKKMQLTGTVAGSRTQLPPTETVTKIWTLDNRETALTLSMPSQTLMMSINTWSISNRVKVLKKRETKTRTTPKTSTGSKTRPTVTLRALRLCVRLRRIYTTRCETTTYLTTKKRVAVRIRRLTKINNR